MKLITFGVLLTLGSWVVAWSEFIPLKYYSFFPLWLGYILTINGISQLLLGASLLKQLGLGFISLFLISIPFWWYFEFLNHFANSWNYHFIQPLSSVEYVLRASISFSVVVPAVFSTVFLFYHILLRIHPLNTAKLPIFKWYFPILISLGIISHILLILIPVYVFPLMWVALTFILIPLNYRLGFPSLLQKLQLGDWTLLFTITLVMLFIGFWWEMWNFYSFPKWSYSIPFVGGYKVFEMPILGYLGYPFFGLEVYLYTHLISGIINCLSRQKIILLNL